MELRKFFLLPLVLLGVIFFAPTTAAAQRNVYEDQVVNLAYNSRNVILNINKYGYTRLDSGLMYGYITRGNFQDTWYNLQAGYTYSFAGVCDEDCSDADMYFYDLDGTLLAKDDDADDTPLVAIVVRTSGKYRIRVRTPGCSAPVGCYWAIQAMWRQN